MASGTQAKVKELPKTFRGTLTKCLELERKWIAFQRPAAWKLSAEAWIREASKLAGLERQELQDLEWQLVGLDDDGPAWMGIRRLVNDITGASGRTMSAPANARVVRCLLRDDALTELASVGCTTLGAQAVAAKRAASRHPSAFGSCDDIEARHQEKVDLEAERERAHEHLLGLVRLDDLLVDDVSVSMDERNRGMAMIQWAAAPTVPFFPRRHAVERLLGALIGREAEEAKEAAKAA